MRDWFTLSSVMNISTEVAHIFNYFLSRLKLWIVFDKNVLSYILGDDFHKRVWSPWFRLRDRTAFFAAQLFLRPTNFDLRATGDLAANLKVFIPYDLFCVLTQTTSKIDSKFSVEHLSHFTQGARMYYTHSVVITFGLLVAKCGNIF
jgi:hypothetical protein